MPVPPRPPAVRISKISDHGTTTITTTSPIRLTLARLTGWPQGLGLAVGPRQGNSTVWFQQWGAGLYWDSGSPHCPQTRPSGKLFWPLLPELEWVRAPCTARPLELMEIPDPLPGAARPPWRRPQRLPPRP